jgi:hypothetical protein
MGQRAGSADLPLHGRRVPAWLGQRMTRLGTVIVEAIVLEYGRVDGRSCGRSTGNARLREATSRQAGLRSNHCV